VKNLIILQARMSSTRLPGKVLQEINGIPLIEFQINRIRQSKIKHVIVATTIDSSDDVLVEHLDSIGVESRRGPLHDVAVRFQEVINEFKPTSFVRLTADCPLMMPELLNEMIDCFEKQSVDYLCNTNPPTYPDGLDIEIVRTSAFLDLIQQELTDLEREHVTLGLTSKSRNYKRQNYGSMRDLSNLRWTVDYPDDLTYLRKLMLFFRGEEATFSFHDLLQLVDSHEELADTRDNRLRNVALSQGSAKRGDHHE
jgi:spore coat polysaccharide biosynthesis protein SpsF (cytidylyltransferase family)